MTKNIHDTYNATILLCDLVWIIIVTGYVALKEIFVIWKMKNQ
jgi:hypothetical protein